MTGAEDADRAELIVKLIDRNVCQAIKLRAYFCRCAYQGQDVRKRFDHTKAAQGFKTVLDSMYFELILTMARLFDDPDDESKVERTAAIPVLLGLLSQIKTRQELQRRSVERKTPKNLRDQHGSPAPEDFVAQLRADAVRSAEAETQDIERLIDEYKTIAGSHLIGRIRRSRNEFLAHTAIEPSRNNRAAYGDAEELLEKAIPLVARLQSAVRNCHASFEDENRIWDEHAEIFCHALS